MDYQTSPLAVARIADGVRVSFNGPIHTNVAWMEGELDRIVKTRPRVVELDLLNTEHISSLGLGLLVAFNRQIKAGGGVVTVVAIRKQTLKTLRVARLDTMLTIAPDALKTPPAP